MSTSLAVRTIAVCALAVSPWLGAAPLSEHFDAGVPAGWTVTNLSDPLGTIGWFQGNAGVFTAQSGADDAYLGANFNSGASVADISNWLILPTSVYQNGDTLSFYTRTIEASLWADNLELRFSSIGGTDVGTSSSSVGSFSNLLLSVNPSLTASGYPDSWTQYSVSLAGLAGATNGAFAFRYVVPGGGPDGALSNYIGIDSVEITGTPVNPVSEPQMALTLLLGVGMLSLGRRGACRV